MMYPLTIHWPADITSLNITETQKNSLDRFLSVFIPDYMRTRIPFNPPLNQKFTYLNRQWTILLPFTFLYDASGHLRHLILHLSGDQFILGQGTQRAVGKCYDLFKGRFRAEKIVSNLEKEILSQLNGQGIPKNYGFYQIRKNDEIKTYVVEKLYEMTLDNWLDDDKIQLSMPDRLHLMLQVIKGLASLHKIKLNTQNVDVPVIHFDIKLSNILVRKKKTGVFDLALSDFGYVGEMTKICGTQLALSPEYYENLLQSKTSDKKNFAFNKKHGTARDVWAMGHLFACLFTMHKFNTFLGSCPPLDFILFAFANAIENKPNAKLKFQDVHFDEKLRQQDLNNLKEPIKQSKTLVKVVDLIGKMLSIQPENRPTAQKCCNQLSYIVNKIDANRNKPRRH